MTMCTRFILTAIVLAVSTCAFESKLTHRLQRQTNYFGSFDPNQLNSQIGANYNPNAYTGAGGGTSMFGNTGTGMGMFNPNAMMGSFTGSQSTGTGSSSTGSGASSTGSGTGAMSLGTGTMSLGTGSSSSGTGSTGTSSGSSATGTTGSGSNTGSQSFTGGSTYDPNKAGTSAGGSNMMYGSGGGSSSGSGGSSIPSYNPDNVINTGAKYDPNAANNGFGGGGAAPSFANGMGMNASQQMPDMGNGVGTGVSNSTSGTTTGSGSATASSATSAAGGPSASSTGSLSNGGISSGTGSSAMGSAQTGSATGTQTGSVPPGTSQTGAVSGGTSSSSGGSSGAKFDPLSTNAMATAGFNPLNPMLGKDMSAIMGPQNPMGGSNPSGFDASKMNAQLGSNGMSLNMFGGAGSNTDMSKADAGSVMTGAQGMLAGSNAINSGGNALMSGGSMGTGSGTGSTSGATSGTSSATGTSGGTDMNALSGGSTGGTSGTGTNSTGSGSSSGSMSMFNPNAMMGTGSMNPMMPGGSVNPLAPAGGSNPMDAGSMLGGSGSMSGGGMMGGSTQNMGGSGGNSTADRSSVVTNPADSTSSPLDPLGAMAGGAKNFSGGSSNLVDPMGFMGGGGLTGDMGNMFSLGRRAAVAIDRSKLSAVHGRRDVSANSAGLYDVLRGFTAYNPMDPLGFLVQGNNKQYTHGNGVDTQEYDPDRYAFMYTDTQFLRGPSFIANVFNPAYPDIATKEPSTSQSKSPMESAKMTTKPTNVGIHSSTIGRVQTTSTAAPQRNLWAHSISGNIFSANNPVHTDRNVSAMVPSVSGNDLQSIIGIGSRPLVPTARPDNIIGIQQSQYIPANIRNITETLLAPPVFNGQPGMKGNAQQRIDAIPDPLSIANNTVSQTFPYTSHYSGFPGILGFGQMQTVKPLTTGNSNGSLNVWSGTTNTKEQSVGNNKESSIQGTINQTGLHIANTKEQSNFDNNINNGENKSDGRSAFTGFGSFPNGVNTNNWKGEWPDKSSTDKDWSGDWSDNWPDKQDGGTLTKVTTTTTSDLSSHIEPHQSTVDNNSPYDTEKLNTALAALQRLLETLKNSVTSIKPTNNQHAEKSYSELVAGWAREMRPE